MQLQLNRTETTGEVCLAVLRLLRIKDGRYVPHLLCGCLFQIAPLVIEALDFDNKELLLVMIDVLIHFVQTKHATVAHSLQSVLPRLIKLSTYVKSMVCMML